MYEQIILFPLRMELHYQSNHHRCHRYRGLDRSTKLHIDLCRQDHILHRGFRDIGYHFYITRDGEIHRGRALEKVGAHCCNHNSHSIGICYEGGLDADGKPKDTRTLNQQGSLLALLRELQRQFPKALIVGHRDLNPMKECPCFNCIAEYREL